jgi:histone H3/H4
VTYALGALYYLCNPSTKKEILKPNVVRIMREYAAVGAVNTSFSNMANAFLEKHVDL